jgi:type IV secretory pathway protease TraF
VARARSGDKGGTANVGLWTTTDDAAAWLAEVLTAEKIRELLPEAADLPVTVQALPNLRAVNVVIDGLLGRGVAASTRFDPQGKAVGEWLRGRVLDVPEALL